MIDTNIQSTYWYQISTRPGKTCVLVFSIEVDELDRVYTAAIMPAIMGNMMQLLNLGKYAAFIDEARSVNC